MSFRNAVYVPNNPGQHKQPAAATRIIRGVRPSRWAALAPLDAISVATGRVAAAATAYGYVVPGGTMSQNGS